MISIYTFSKLLMHIEINLRLKNQCFTFYALPTVLGKLCRCLLCLSLLYLLISVYVNPSFIKNGLQCPLIIRELKGAPNYIGLAMIA